MGNELTKEQKEILDLLEYHKTHVSTAREWDEYAKKKNLPSSFELIHLFGKWNNVKEYLKIEPVKKFYGKDILIDIAKEHSNYFTSQRKWNEYAMLHKLPLAITYIKAFGKWNNAKEILNLPPSPITAPMEYTKEEILKIVREHGAYMESKQKWDEYVKGKRLPTYKTLKKHFEWDELLELAGKEIRRQYTREDLINIGIKHYEVFGSASRSRWTDYAKVHSLPSAQTYYREFGGWKNAKIAVLKAYQ